jgi:hypothetical protein
MQVFERFYTADTGSGALLDFTLVDVPEPASLSTARHWARPAELDATALARRGERERKLTAWTELAKLAGDLSQSQTTGVTPRLNGCPGTFLDLIEQRPDL